MKTRQPSLIIFSVFQTMGLFNPHITISRAGIVHADRQNCPICGALGNYNGNSNKGKHILSKGSNGVLRKGQQHCPDCNTTFQVENPWLDIMINSMNEFVASQVLSLSFNLSEEEIMKPLEKTMTIMVSKSTIHKIISSSNEELEGLEFDYEIKDGFYGYDEQYLMINGRRAYRLVFYDLTTNTIIYEKIHYSFSKKILKAVLSEVFGDNVPKGFVVDMRIEYPKAFREVFGRKIKIQYCIFHLNKLILKEYRECLSLGKKVNWTLMHYYNMYSLFNIFYNRTYELELLKEFMTQHDNFRLNLTDDTIRHYVEKYNIKLKNAELQRKKVIEIKERKLMKAFRTILHDRKNERKRKKTTLEVRDVESARKQFMRIYGEKGIYPKKIQDRIEKIKANFEYFIASEGEVLTNNRLEGFFGASLKKFRKKMRRSLQSFSAMLTRKRLEQQGRTYFRTFTIEEIARIFAVATFFS